MKKNKVVEHKMDKTYVGDILFDEMIYPCFLGLCVCIVFWLMTKIVIDHKIMFLYIFLFILVLFVCWLIGFAIITIYKDKYFKDWFD